jgi:hypothetical protein
MRAETKRKLDWELRRRRLKIGALALTAVCGVIGMLVLTDLDAKVDDHRVPAHVDRVSVPAVKGASQAVAVDVTLDDGRHVQVYALKVHEPHVGDRVDITEHRHATVRVTYSWN